MTNIDWQELEQMRERLAALSRRLDHTKQRLEWEIKQSALVMRARMLTNYDEDKDKP